MVSCEFPRFNNWLRQLRELIPFGSGTGLFLGTGGALANGGPLGLFMGYSLMGSICYSVMVGVFT